MSEQKKYILVNKGTIPLSGVVNDCSDLCVPAIKGESLASILNKICAKTSNTSSVSQEVDPYFTASPAYGITNLNVTQWNLAYTNMLSSENVQDITGGMLTNTDTVNLTYNDGLNSISADVIIGGIDNSLLNLVVWDGSSFKLRQVSSILNSAYTIHTVTSASYTVTDTIGEHIYLCDTSAAAGTITINLPTVVGNTAKYTFKQINAANMVIVDANGLETIDQDTTATIAFQNTAFTIVSDNTAWHIINKT